MRRHHPSRPLVEPQAKPVPVCTVRQLMGPHPPAQARLRGHIVRVRTGRGELVYVACMLCHAALNKVRLAKTHVKHGQCTKVERVASMQDANGVYQMCEECAGCVDERAGQCEWVYRPWTLEVTDASGMLPTPTRAMPTLTKYTLRLCVFSQMQAEWCT